MPSHTHLLSTTPELSNALGQEGELEYHRLLSMVEDAQGLFAPMPIRSDFSPQLRESLLDRLATDLAPLKVRQVALNRDDCDAANKLLAAARELDGEGLLVLTGMEQTPDVIPVPGSLHRRPPVLSSLNYGRERLRVGCEMPMLIWCTSDIYSLFKDLAPDFFDHFASVFTFLNEVPAMRSILPLPSFRQPETKPDSIAPIGIEPEIAYYQRELASHSEPTLERANILDQLGLVLTKHPTGNRATQLQQAIRYFEEALTIVCEERDPIEWSAIQNSLGNAYSQLPFGERGDNLLRAIDCYAAALSVCTEQDFPKYWAMIENNLGIAYAELPVGDRDSNLRRAIACYEAALRVYTEQIFPQEWARTENNLGLAYSNLPSGDKDGNLRRAIACYEAALRVYTEQTFPQLWALTENNLGLAYFHLPSGDRDGNLRRAIACLEAAQKICSEQAFPQDWANTLFNLALVRSELGERHIAREAMQRSALIFRSIGLEQDALDAEEWLQTHPESN